MADEPNAAGGGAFSASFQQQGRGRNKTFTGTGSISMEIPGIKQVSQDLQQVTNALNNLKSAIQSMSSAFTTGPVVNMLSQISRSAQTTTQNLNALSSAIASTGRGGGMAGGGGGGYGGGGRGGGIGGGYGGGGGGGGGNAFGYGNSNGGVGGGNSSPLGSLGQTIGGGINKATSSLVSSIPLVGGFLNSALEFTGDMAMGPLRFMRERVNKNRAAAYTMAGDLTPYQWSTGKGVDELMRSLRNIPGNMQGNVNDVLNALNVGRSVGASYGFGGEGGKRANEFYSAVGDFQKISPGLGAGRVASIVGNQLNNTQANQAAAFYTGGAFSMLAQGGGMKSASQWAEGIYNWLKNQRPGRDRGKDFNYGELLGQNFPGSNINAWFDTVGVSSEMRDYWWSWALAKTKTGAAGSDVFSTMEKGGLEGNQAWRKAAANTVMTRNEFGLAGQMTGMYAQREVSNKWFNQMMGSLVNRAVPAMSQTGLFSMLQYMPDEVEQVFYNLLESSGPIGQIVGGGATIASGGGLLGIAGNALVQGGMPSLGDVGDLGDGGYGAYGGSGLAGLNPDIRAKVARMMQANPRLKMTSGLRDGYTSAKLKRKGVGNFGSGTPFMGDVGSPNRHSPHSAGWAADLGPRSEYGWLKRNAHKFGLETASGFGEPWHVQNAGTLSGFGGPMGKGKIGDLGDPGGDVGFPGFDILGSIPGVGELIDLVKGIAKTIDMIGRVIGAVFGAFDSVGKVLTSDFLSTADAGPGKVKSKAEGYLSMMGLGATSGNASGTVIPYDPKYAASLPTSLNLDENAIRGPGFSTTTGGGALIPGDFSGGGGSSSVQQILRKYAGNNSVEAKSADASTAAKILATLKVAAGTGLTGDELIAAVSLAGRESNFNPNVRNPNRSTGDDSYGLWQINMLGSMGASRRKALGITSDDQLYDPAVNARAMKMLYDASSTPFYHWGPYKGQAPLFGGAEDWVPAVYSVAKAGGYVGDPGMDYQASGGGVTRQSIQFNNTFNISGGSSSSGVDVGRLVPIMATRLEEEMRKRLAVSR